MRDVGEAALQVASDAMHPARCGIRVEFDDGWNNLVKPLKVNVCMTWQERSGNPVKTFANRGL